MRNNRMHTIYDVLDASGFFAANPANVGSRDPEGRALYKGPIAYPKMLYHPKGETRVVEPERREPAGPLGIVTIPARRELIHRVVNSAEEEAQLIALGWHDHPAKAIAAGGGIAPPISSVEHIKNLEDELVRLQAQLAQAGADLTAKGVSSRPDLAPLV